MRLAFDARCEAEAHSSFARVLQLLRKAAEEVSIPIENWRHGIGNDPLVAAAHPKFGEKRAPFVLNGGRIRCHNLPLQILATQGLLGFIPFLWFAWSLLKPFLHSWKNLGQAEVLGICAWLIHAGTSITDTPSFQSVRLGAFTLLIGFALGLLLSKESAEMK
jgi:O-antigen ligase